MPPTPTTCPGTSSPCAWTAPNQRRVTYFYDDDPAASPPDGRWLVRFSGEALHVVAVDGPANYCLAGEGGYGALEWLP